MTDLAVHHYATRPDELAAPGAPAATGAALAATGVAAYWRSQLRFGLAGNAVRPFVDGPEALRAMRKAIERAVNKQHFVYLLGWWCDPWVHLDGPGTALIDLLSAAGERGVQSRLLIWDSPALIYPGHSQLHDAAVVALNRIPGCFAQQDAGGGLTSTKSHHQKLLVVQGSGGLEAFCGGVDINVDRLHHLPPPPSSYRADRPHVGWNGASGGSGGGKSAQTAGSPFHDVHAQLRGPTALPLLRTFLRRWYSRSGDRQIDTRDPLRATFDHPVPPVAGRHFVRVGETFNGTVALPGRAATPSRKVTVQDIWLRSILGARQFIYIEDQYLISTCAARAIRQVLPRLQHVTILVPPSEMTDIPGVWQRRKNFVELIVKGNPHAAKLHVYTRAALLGGKCVRQGETLRHLYVHAKMAVVDDELMLIGSANCNNRGWETDSELVVATFENGRGASSVAGRLRADLWAHHLNVPVTSVADPVAGRALWDTAPKRHVCGYDPVGGKDPWGSDRPDSIIDPSDRRPGDPCTTLLTGAATP